MEARLDELVQGERKEQVKIERLSKEEFKALRNALVDLYLESYKGLEEYAYHKRWMVKRYLGWLYHGDPQGFFVLTVNGKLAGFAASHSRWIWNGKVGGEIHELVIAPAFRRQGLGKLLLKHVINYLFSKGRRHIGLWVGVGNEVAKALYQKTGFRPQGSFGVWERWVLEKPPNRPQGR